MINNKYYIEGLPDELSKQEIQDDLILLKQIVTEIQKKSKSKEIALTISNKKFSTLNTKLKKSESPNDDVSTEKRAEQYKAQPPLFSLDQLIVPETVRENILSAIETLKVKDKVFKEWNLQTIEPFPRTALNFYGKPGTGKTLAAQGIANELGKPIIVASYAQIESKFHGDGPKNVEALFCAAQRDNAILFIDEADSLLSKRLTDVNQGSERAANSMTSQLLICLEKFEGVVIFATNLVENYDTAFETRIRHIEFPLPDENARKYIWQKHLPAELPLNNVFVENLAKVDDICGRDIKNAVIDTAVRAARKKQDYIEEQELIDAINRIKSERTSTKGIGKPLTEEEKTKVEEQIKNALLNKDNPSNGNNNRHHEEQP